MVVRRVSAIDRAGRVRQHPGMSTDRPSKIQATIDLDADGKRFGALVVPHSRNDSAWGSIRIPIAVIRNGDGPCALLVAGNHGDEYEGQIALRDLARTLDPVEVSGTVIVLPGLNYPAVRSANRCSPIDGGNMNRSFPGQPDGTITQMIAHYVATVLVPRADLVLDLHSGGKTLDFVPFAATHRLTDKALEARAIAAVEAFGAPVGVVMLELDAEGMLDTWVEGLGKLFVTTELAGGGSTTVRSNRVAATGVRNVLKHMGILKGEPEIAAPSHGRAVARTGGLRGAPQRRADRPPLPGPGAGRRLPGERGGGSVGASAPARPLEKRTEPDRHPAPPVVGIETLPGGHTWAASPMLSTPRSSSTVLSQFGSISGTEDNSRSV